MAWILRVTHRVPYGKKQEYQQLAKKLFGEIEKGEGVEHMGSYRVAFGNSKEYMHLLKFEKLADYENVHVPPACRVLKKLQDSNLFDESFWEWLRPLGK